MPKKFKRESARELAARKKAAKEAKKKRTVKKQKEKMSNKEIAYAYLAISVRDAVLTANDNKLNIIAGSTLRGARPDKVREMIEKYAEKLVQRQVALLDKNGLDKSYDRTFVKEADVDDEEEDDEDDDTTYSSEDEDDEDEEEDEDEDEDEDDEDDD